ncbi:similar to Saccharomyces cerevisiae YDL095W PMT1 Protein O-mannosyltransferase, transfers mannose from dolichyl phosphate-D-mannose to protein Ser/Thr residues [Maudiozyma barnettii]|uniref:Dolichyl-phosphate-mannose--protein mannosyltransferase n=1 Tax=Maudiozyma barnettii TaxID=61262 RepID=A0A8H2VKH5_9SACH|nr:uncharacterized protein KABA2_13S02574 [Kazachstania barnettii]CAB4257082.1 similar to Saccharomyces cerevisiae YDL095W PMT1 Protein O-mannosyltransferase, transfers mannose from dolichyl phosphate-D-mannose to protein Ser/Thr residues [Kazachstania barnettii]CAD1779453.1 similar to Saccharomyces cerevisiae YDL095W PMT1 Protein O-mannosyltransferase, transfers mannose from dolichyl phosphate-D-mannose to protein Ser/Thr residues [Kazachstania barnettii]
MSSSGEKIEKIAPVMDASPLDPVVPIEVKQGPVRPYLVSEPPNDLATRRTISTLSERLYIIVLIAFTAVVRLYGLEWPNSVVFDEVHFGGFATEYINGSFFMDVHPPLAKMLYAGVASLAGFKGDFDFENIGDEFPSTTPYYHMRLFSASLGAFTVVLLYFTLRSSGVRQFVAFVSALCFAIENSYVTISRYILLDAPLMFFIAAAVYSFKKYELFQQGSIKSYKTLLATGIALGFAASAKWVGLFTVAWIGLLCIWRLWFMLGDLSKPVSSTVSAAFSKLIFLLGVPFALYAFFFKIHFDTLIYDGAGASFFSSEFRSTLQGNTIPTDISADVGVSSVVSLRHFGTSGGYLHSHPFRYETGSGQQQITLYPHIDENNQWLVELSSNPGVTFPDFQNLSDGAIVRLLHPSTHCRLHSHDHKAPVSESADWQTEVSCYGFTGFEGDTNDNWVLEIDQKKSAPGVARERVVALETKFRLKHMVSNCYLFSHDVKLPKWGFDQQEVSCATTGRYELTLWYIEANENHALPEDARHVSYVKPGFWGKFIESHIKMWSVNKNLVETHIYESLPEDWPLLLRGISYWGDHHRMVYLLGNAIEWWAVSAFMLLFVIVCVIELIAWQLGKPILQDDHVFNFHVQVAHYMLGFLVHVGPSFLMKRQMFLHHYLPAYYFGILAFGHALDIIVSFMFKNKKIMGNLIVITFFAGCLFFFNAYKPLIYGLPWTVALCEKSQWLSGWDYHCGSYFNTYEEYDNYTITSQFDNIFEDTDVPMSTYSKQLEVDQPVVIEEIIEDIPIEAAEEDLVVEETSGKSATGINTPEKEDSFDDIIHKEGFNRFLDENGEEIDIEEVRKIMAAQGGALKIEQKIVEV